MRAKSDEKKLKNIRSNHKMVVLQLKQLKLQLANPLISSSC